MSSAVKPAMLGITETTSSVQKKLSRVNQDSQQQHMAMPATEYSKSLHLWFRCESLPRLSLAVAAASPCVHGMSLVFVPLAT